MLSSKLFAFSLHHSKFTSFFFSDLFYHSVDKEWNRAFVDLIPDDLALRKIINFADLTVCLDKTNASGHIESYQEPMAYRCAVTCRFIMEYDSVTAKFPRVTISSIKSIMVFCSVVFLFFFETDASLRDSWVLLLLYLLSLSIALLFPTKQSREPTLFVD